MRPPISQSSSVELAKKSRDTLSKVCPGKSTSVPTLMRIDFFEGFDELYLAKNFELASVKVEQAFTSDRCNFAVAVPSEFLDLFQRLEAVRFLSDGVGPKYVCEPELAIQLENIVEDANS